MTARSRAVRALHKIHALVGAANGRPNCIYTQNDVCVAILRITRRTGRFTPQNPYASTSPPL